MAVFPPATETGTLGVFQIRRIWASACARRHGDPVPRERADEWNLDHVVLCGLNLALEETLQYLSQRAPSFAAFEQWILQRNGGALDPRQIARINAAVTGDHPTKPLPIMAEADCVVPVLSRADHEHWVEHGYVIVRGAISREQAAAAADALWRHRDMNPEDQDTWYPGSDHGIMVQLFHHPALEANRRSARVRRAFEEIWGTDDLWMTTDRVSFNPPERGEWRFPGPHLHWDADLSVRPFPFATQGLIYLTDTPAHGGAFACVPGFHRRLDSWLAALPPGADPYRHLGDLEAKPIPAEAGDLVIWHHALPHGATSNSGAQPRIVHYVSMLPTPRWHKTTADETSRGASATARTAEAVVGAW